MACEARKQAEGNFQALGMYKPGVGESSKANEIPFLPGPSRLPASGCHPPHLMHPTGVLLNLPSKVPLRNAGRHRSIAATRRAAIQEAPAKTDEIHCD